MIPALRVISSQARYLACVRSWLNSMPSLPATVNVRIRLHLVATSSGPGFSTCCEIKGGEKNDPLPLLLPMPNKGYNRRRHPFLRCEQPVEQRPLMDVDAIDARHRMVEQQPGLKFVDLLALGDGAVGVPQ